MPFYFYTSAVIIHMVVFQNHIERIFAHNFVIEINLSLLFEAKTRFIAEYHFITWLSLTCRKIISEFIHILIKSSDLFRYELIYYENFSCLFFLLRKLAFHIKKNH